MPTARPSHDPPSRDATIRRCVWIGMAVNALLAAIKLAVGLLAHSRALVTDAIHSLSDFGTDGVILIGSRYWSRPPDAGHPYGHRRIETLVTVAIGGALALAGVLMGWNAVLSLTSGTPGPPPGAAAFVAALLSVGLKEALYRWTVVVGRRTHSLALQANAWHHRSDAWSSIPVALAVGGSRIMPSWNFLDGAGALVVSVMLVQAAYRIMRPAFGELTELGAPENMTEDLGSLVRSVPGVLGVHNLRTRYAGSRLLVDLHVQVDPRATVQEGHGISSRVCDAIHRHEPDILEVLVHIEPYASSEPKG